MYPLLVAYRYVLSRLITFVGLLIVTWSVMVLIIVISVMEGFRSELERRIRGTASDVKVESKLYVGLRNPERVESILRGIPGVENTSSHVEALTLFRPDHRFFWWALDAADREAEERYLTTLDLENPAAIARFEEYIRDLSPPDLPAGLVANAVKEFFSALPGEVEVLFSRQWIEQDLWKIWRKLGHLPQQPENTLPPAVLGIEHARNLLLLPGDRIHLTSFSPLSKESTEGEFLVAGYFKTGLYELDAKGIVLSLKDAADFLKLRDEEGEIRVSGVRVTADEAHRDGPKLQALRDAIDRALVEKEVLLVRTRTWREARASLLQAVRVEKAIMSIILGALIFFIGLMIFIILTVQVVDKSRDIGVLQSIGANPRGVAAIFFTIALSLSVAGVLLGAVYGITLALGVNTVLRWLTLLTGLEVFPADVYYLDQIPVLFQPGDLLFIVVPTVLASLLASIVPALRAARKDPAVTLRYE